MILGCHLIFGAYGFWLPNDPRGSGSELVWAAHLRRFGPGTKVATRQSVAHRPHDNATRLAAKRALGRPPIRFNGRQALAVAHGIGVATGRLQIVVHACAVMPDHVHLVVARHRMPHDVIAAAVKRFATRQLTAEGLHPYQEAKAERKPTLWGVGGWTVFLDSIEKMRRAIAYVEQNPSAAGFKAQRWSFVVPYSPSPRGRGG